MHEIAFAALYRPELRCRGDLYLCVHHDSVYMPQLENLRKVELATCGTLGAPEINARGVLKKIRGRGDEEVQREALGVTPNLKVEQSQQVWETPPHQEVVQTRRRKRVGSVCPETGECVSTSSMCLVVISRLSALVVLGAD